LRSVSGPIRIFRPTYKWPAVLWQSNPECFAQTLLKLFKILARQIKTVGMIDAKSCHCFRAHQLKNESVNGVKHLWQLDPNCGQVIHIKKAAVINFLGGDPPKTASR